MEKTYHKFVFFALKILTAYFLAINLSLLAFPKTAYGSLIDFSHFLPVVHLVFYVIFIASLAYFIFRQPLNNSSLSVCSLILWLTVFLWGWPNYGRYFAIFMVSAMTSVLIFPLIKKWRLTEKRFNLANNIVFLIIAVIYLWISLIRHYNFGSHSFDLGIYAQAVYKYAYFQGFFNTIRGINQFGDHFSPILFLIAPLFWIFKSATTLIVVQAISLTLAGWLLGKIIYGKTKDFWLSISLATGYYLFVGIQNAVAFDFHLVSFFPLVFVLIFWSILNHKIWQYWLFIFLALVTKENATIYIFFLGLFLLFMKEYRAKGWQTMAVSLLGYYLIIKLAMPYFSQGINQSYEYFNFQSLGNTPTEAVKTIITRPWYAWQIFINDSVKRQSQLILLFSTGLAPFVLAPWTILLIAPMLFEFFLFDRQVLWGMGYHYGVAVAIPLFISVYLAQKSIETFSPKIKEYLPFVIIGFAALFSFNSRSTIFSLLTDGADNRLINKNYRINYQMMAKIPANASVAASHHLVPHLAMRNDIIGWPPVKWEAYVTNLKQDYLIISNVGSGASWPNDCKGNIETVNAGIDSGYGIIEKEKGVYLLKKNENNQMKKLNIANECGNNRQ